MYFAIGVEPTKDTDAISGCSKIRSTATLSPCTTLKTPSGKPASLRYCAVRIDVVGSFSLGLTITALPAPIAIGKNHIGTIAGKLNGEMIAQTPSGWRIEYTSILVDTFSLYEPFKRCGIPQANSTTSSPLVTSPRASENTFPCSAVIALASSSLRAFAISRNAKSTCARFAREALRHSLAAALAAVTA